MKNYEKPIAEIVDFTNEEIMDETGADGQFSKVEEGIEPWALE